jgi:hypothetical protein
MSPEQVQIQELTTQLMWQVRLLQQAIAANDAAATASAFDTVEQTTTTLDQLVNASETPAADTMILYVTSQLLEQVDQLNSIISAAGDANAAAGILVETTITLDQCVKKMAEMQPQPKQYQNILMM